MGRDLEYLAFSRVLARAMSGAPPQTVAEERAAQADGLAQLPRAPVALIEDVTVAGRTGRLYHPEPGTPLPGLVYFHGGGFSNGSVNAYEPIVRSLVAGSGCPIVAVDFRPAPEHPFPAAIEDAYETTIEVLDRAAEFGLSRVGIGGDASGGNLAAVTATRLGDRLAAQVLLCAVVDLTEEPVAPPDPDGLPTIKDSVDWHKMLDRYLAGADPAQPFVSPVLTEDLSGVAPAMILVAEYDRLREQGLRYAERLRAAGVPVNVVDALGLDHAFLAWADYAQRPREAADEVCAAIRTILRG